jgi:hypothetical protein
MGYGTQRKFNFTIASSDENTTTHLNFIWHNRDDGVELSEYHFLMFRFELV